MLHLKTLLSLFCPGGIDIPILAVVLDKRRKGIPPATTDCSSSFYKNTKTIGFISQKIRI